MDTYESQCEGMHRMAPARFRKNAFSAWRKPVALGYPVSTEGPAILVFAGRASQQVHITTLMHWYG